MSLGLKAYHGTGEFSPRIEYSAKDGHLTRVDRTADGTETIRIDQTFQQPAYAFDIGSIEIGWLNFQDGIAPSFAVVPFGQPMPARPDRGHKAGFRSKVWDGQTGPREFSSSAGVTVTAIEALWDQLTTTPEAAAGKVPVIQFGQPVAVRTGRNTNYAPGLRLLQWIDRDERVFGPRTVAAPGQPAIVPVAANTNQAPPAQAAPPAWPVAAPVAPPAAWPVAA
jgi:hypothetical protein